MTTTTNIASTPLTFTTREQYVAWRAQWRKEYAELSSRIRKENLALKDAFRGKGTASTWTIRHNLVVLRSTARAMLEMRAASKVRAQEQHKAAHPTELLVSE